jgi:hypothetical protein
MCLYLQKNIYHMNLEYNKWTKLLGDIGVTNNIHESTLYLMRNSNKIGNYTLLDIRILRKLSEENIPVIDISNTTLNREYRINNIVHDTNESVMCLIQTHAIKVRNTTEDMVVQLVTDEIIDKCAILSNQYSNVTLVAHTLIWNYNNDTIISRYGFKY